MREYPVDLLTCTDSAQVLDWICQIAGRFGERRDGARAHAVGSFALALNEILDPQANLCSFGKPTIITQDVIRQACQDARRDR